jgi:rhodanese-related sulfurtransferase
VQAGDEIVKAPDARTLLDRGAVFLDARPRDFWKMSRIPGALPLPEDEFDLAFAEAEQRLRRASGIVVYCSGFGCEASHIARKLRSRLHRRDPRRASAGRRRTPIDLTPP